MPSVSKKQRNFMAAAAHNPEIAKKAGIPVSVAKEFNAADKGKKFKSGGDVADYKSSKGKVYRGGQSVFDEDKYVSPSRAKSLEEANAKPWLIGSKEAQENESRSLGKAMQDARDYRESRKIVDRINPEGGSSTPEERYKKGGVVKKRASTSSKKLSSASSRADGIAQRGKTRGRYV